MVLIPPKVYRTLAMEAEEAGISMKSYGKFKIERVGSIL